MVDYLESHVVLIDTCSFRLGYRIGARVKETFALNHLMAVYVHQNPKTLGA